jgi:glycine/D-amino acid oxidase-like deaminating enzyme
MYPDVVAAGNGIIGACGTCYLSVEGVSVHLMERDHIASGASGAAEGNICYEAVMPLAWGCR